MVDERGAWEARAMTDRKLVTGDEAIVTPSQHAAPCSDCPWARGNLAGWLGSMSAAEWLAAAHGETIIDCHALKRNAETFHQCAGAATYRANMAKLCRDPSILRLPADRAQVFATPDEFKKHHDGGTKMTDGRSTIPMKDHYVTLHVQVPDDVDHSTVQSLVLTGSREALDKAEIDRGPIMVVGFDRAKLETERDKMHVERDELRKAWQDAEERLRNTEASIRQRARHSRP